MAVDFLENRQIDHTQAELQVRFRAAMSGEAGNDIAPITVPLTERYVSEAANVFNTEVPYVYEYEDGSEDDETRKQTLKLSRLLAKARYDEVMHLNEQMMVLLAPTPSIIWYQGKRGAVRPVVVMPHNIRPIVPDSPAFADAADPEDYAGHVIEVFHQAEADTQKRTFAMVTAAQVVYYEGSESGADTILSKHKNPVTWPQVVDMPDATDPELLRPVTREAPLSPITFWHSTLAKSTLLPDTDCGIAQFNLDINIALSSLMDTLSWQGHAVPVLNVMNPSSPKAKQRYGARFPMTLNVGEAFGMVSAATSYTEQVEVLKYLVQLAAIARRMSPNDFATDGTSPASGFAKLIDSLPKIEAREERIRPLRYYSEEVAAPRITAIGVYTGQLDDTARKMRMRVKFPEVQFPLSEDEKTKKLERGIKYHLTSIIKEIAKAEGVTEDEAREIYEKNKADNEGLGQQEQASVTGFGGTSLGNGIRQPGRANGGTNAGPAAQRDRSARGIQDPRQAGGGDGRR